MEHCHRIALVAASVLLGLSACSTTTPDASRPLPMRLAVLPIRSVSERQRAATDELDPTDMVLKHDGLRYAQAVVDALDEQVFTQAFLLTPDASGTIVDPVALADTLGADALLTLDLGCDPRVFAASNSSIYPNYLLFSIGGPFCWWLKDRTYNVEAKLSARLYDVPRLLREHAEPGSEASVLAHITDASAPFGEMNMSFTNRAGGDVGKYCLSVVWPAPLLARDSDALRDRIEEQTIDQLADRLRADMSSDRETIVRAQYLGPFWVDVDGASATIDGSTVRLRVEVLVLAESRVESIGSIQVTVEGQQFRIPAREGPKRSVGGRDHRTFVAEGTQVVTPAHAGSVLRLAVSAETPNLVRRSYSFVLQSARTTGGAGQ